MKAWTPEEDAKVLAMLAEGKTRREIAVAFDVTRNAICGKVDRLKNERPKMSDGWTPEMVERLLTKAPFVVRSRFVLEEGLSQFELYARHGFTEGRRIVDGLSERGWFPDGSRDDLPAGIGCVIYRHNDKSRANYFRTRKMVSNTYQEISEEAKRERRAEIAAAAAMIEAPVGETPPPISEQTPNAETVAAFEELKAGGGEVFAEPTKAVFDRIVSSPAEVDLPGLWAEVTYLNGATVRFDYKRWSELEGFLPADKANIKKIRMHGYFDIPIVFERDENGKMHGYGEANASPEKHCG